jgi:hypothetical protein
MGCSLPQMPQQLDNFLVNFAHEVQPQNEFSALDSNFDTMKFFCLTRVAGGAPDIGQLGTDYTGHVQVDSVGSWGAYLISGSGAQLTAINALPQVIGICSGDREWGEVGES